MRPSWRHVRTPSTAPRAYTGHGATACQQHPEAPSNAPSNAPHNADGEGLSREEASGDALSALEDQVVQLQRSLDASRLDVESLQGSNNVVDHKRITELEEKYLQLKGERIELLQTQSENAHKLLRLAESLRVNEYARHSLEAEIGTLQASLAANETAIDDLRGLVREKNLNIQILQDELQAIQLELLQTDERAQALARENDQLVARWLSKVNETVERLNSQVEAAAPPPSTALEGREAAAASEGGCWVVGRVECDASITSLTACRKASLLLPIAQNYGADEDGPESGGGNALQPSHNAMSILDGARNVIPILDGIESSGRHLRLPPNMRSLAGTSFTRDGDFCAGVVETFEGAGKAPLGQPVNKACIWNMATGRIYCTLDSTPGSDFVTMLPLASTNAAMVSLHRGDCIKLYDIPRAFSFWSESLDLPVAAVKSCKSLSGGDLLAILSKDGRIVLWDVRQRRASRKSSQHLPRVLAIAADPEYGDIVACTESSLLVIDQASLKVVRTITIPPPQGSIRGGAQGRRQAFAAGSAHDCIDISPAGSGKYAAISGSTLYYGDYNQVQGGDHAITVEGGALACAKWLAR